MSFTEKILQTCAPYFEENKNRSFQAQVLDQEKKLLSSGLALLDKENLHGAFWPTNKRPADKEFKNAAILKHSDGREFELSDFKRCPSWGNLHHHFHWKLNKQPEQAHE
jgi:hypothetical protein